MNPDESILSRARPFISEVVLEAGAVLMRYFRQEVETQAKIGNDIVTQADLESEALVAERIRRLFPDHSLIAEEGSRGAPESDYCWYIDPLDGTVNFAAGIPVFAVAVSLTYRNEPVLAAVLDPTRNQLFLAERGQGATLDGAPLRVSATRELSQGVVYLSAFALRRPNLAPSVLATLGRLGPETRNLINLGSAGIAWAYTAAGHIDGDLSFAVDQYTGPAGILLVREAGGRVTDHQGAEWKPGIQTALATNGHLHDALLAQIDR